MKRIPQNIAIETLSYFVSGNQKITIIDRENMYDKGKEVFSGTMLELCTEYAHVKQLRSQIYGIEIDGDTMILTIETKYEEY